MARFDRADLASLQRGRCRDSGRVAVAPYLTLRTRDCSDRAFPGGRRSRSLTITTREPRLAGLTDLEVLYPRPGLAVVECLGEHDLTSKDKLGGLLSARTSWLWLM
jgi:hypothetical protein